MTNITYYDAVIIGAGHNGLVCACYLAAAGHKVKVLERRNIVGGTAVTEEFHTGFRNSTASYTVSLLNPKVIRDLRLKEHGLKILPRLVNNLSVISDNEYLLCSGDIADMQREFARFSQKDADALPAYYAMLEPVADLLRDEVLQTPPNIGGGFQDLLRGAKLGLRVKKLPMSSRRDAMDMFTKSAAEILDVWFESDYIKGLFAFDSVVGNYGSPYTPGSAYVLLHHLFGEVDGKKGAWGHAVGGMGAITQAMLKEAQRLGVDVEVDAAVKTVIIKDGRAIGVELEEGDRIVGRTVVSNVGPKLLYTKMVDPEQLSNEFLRRIKGFKTASGSFRMNVALSELPDFSCLPGTEQQPHHSAGIIIGPTMAYLDQAYMDARQFGWSRQPIVELLIPSTIDDSLAPKGKHVASLFCQQFSPELPNGESWDDHRDAAADTIIDTVNAMAPNFRDSIIARSIHSPLDLERKFGLIGGDIFHGVLSLDQLYSNRPVMGYADYRTPVKGLYMCGSGTHPGGGVTGAPGHNAAMEMIRDFRYGRVSR